MVHPPRYTLWYMHPYYTLWYMHPYYTLRYTPGAQPTPLGIP